MIKNMPDKKREVFNVTEIHEIGSDSIPQELAFESQIGENPLSFHNWGGCSCSPFNNSGDDEDGLTPF